MLRRVPVLSTVIVLAAVAVMVRLGFWQLERMHQKEALLARYSAAATISADVAWPQNPMDGAAALYRHSTITCLDPTGDAPRAGTSAIGEKGWAHIYICKLADGGAAEVALGWSKDPQLRTWSGGVVRGVIGPGLRLVAESPPAGLDPLARPEPGSVPNNHLSYAVQWFLFALTALVIYALALRKRLAAAGGEG